MEKITQSWRVDERIENIARKIKKEIENETDATDITRTDSFPSLYTACIIALDTSIENVENIVGEVYTIKDYDDVVNEAIEIIMLKCDDYLDKNIRK